MRYEVRFRPVAQVEFDEGVNWYAERGVELGRRFTAAIDDCVDVIAETPFRSATVYGEIRLRAVLGFPYQVYYRVLENEIAEVIAVFHVRRNPVVWQRRTK